MMEQIITFHELIKIIKRHLVLIVACVVVFAGVAAFYSFKIAKPEYEASSQLIIVPNPTSKADNSDQANSELTQLINTSKDILQNPIILSSVRDELVSQSKQKMSLSTLQGKVNVTNQANSQMLVVNVTDKNAKRAAKIANLIAESFKGRSKPVLDLDNVMVTAAEVPDSSVSATKKNNLIFGVIIGLIVGLILAFVVEALSRRIKYDDYVTRKYKLEILGNLNNLN